MGLMQINVDIPNFASSDMYRSLCVEFDTLIGCKTPDGAKDSLGRIAKITKLIFGKNIILTVVDNPYFFYGFHVFPSKNLANAIVNIGLDYSQTPIEERKKLMTVNWFNSEQWYIEIDAKLIRDIGNLLNGKDLAILYFYSLIRVIFNPDIIKLTWYNILVCLNDLGRKNQVIATNPAVRKLLTIPIYAAVAQPCFAFDNKVLDEMLGNSSTRIAYKESLSKLINRYGTSSTIEMNSDKFAANTKLGMNWIAEAICDLKYSANRMLHNIQRVSITSNSPYMRLVYKDIILHFNKIQGKFIGIQNALESATPNPDQRAVMERMTEEYWKKQIPVIESQEYFDFIDKTGYVKKVNQRDIDLIRIELDSCDSTEDKIYLMERLYRQIGAIDAGLAMLADPKKASKVRQSKNELLRLKEIAEETTQAIIKFKIAPERYGLYIKYPAGYEG